MATILINRTSEYINKLRDYDVYIDGKKVGTIANGEAKEFNVSPGYHSVCTKIDWCTSSPLSVNISNMETKSLKVGGFKNSKWVMPTGLMLIVLSYVANRLFNFEYLFYLEIPMFLMILYYITFARKRYLTLTEYESQQHETVKFQT